MPRADVPLVFTRARARLAVLAAILMMAVPGSAAAQAVYGSIAGTVTDESGAVLPGVTVSVTSVDRKTVDTAVTNESGYFVRERMIPGTYEVKAELAGFKTAVVPSVVVSVDTQTPINMKLAVGQLTETVEVTGGSPLLKTDRADVATTFDRRQLTDLPVIDRNFTKFILLTPGTQQLGWQHAASENPQGSVQTMVNGQHFSGTGYQLDGTENRDPILGIIVVNPNLDAIGETKITSQNYDAEFGQAIAGVVSVQTKSGTNSLHGSGFEFWTGDNFQARNPFTQFQADPRTGKFIPDTTRNQFGGTIGGKIIENKAFFFGAYQGIRNTQGGSQLLSVPTEAARHGDLSDYGVNIFDPGLDGQTTPANRVQFAGNVIPAGRLSPQAQKILDLIPMPNTTGRDGGIRDNYLANGSEKFNGDQYDTRIDYRLNENSNLFGRYSLANFLRDGPTSFGQGGGHELVSLGGRSDVRNQSLALGYDKSLSSTWLLDVRFGWFKYRVNVLPFDFGTTPAANAGIPNLNFDTTFTSGLPAIFVGGDSTTNPGDFEAGSGLGINRCNCPLDQDEQQWQIVANATKAWNTHTFKFGADVRRAYNLRVPSDSHRSGELHFTLDNTRGPTGGGMGLATFLLGNVTSLNRYVSSSTDARERQWRHFYYAQDTWRPSSKLTLNYGLRLDIINPQTVNDPGNGGWFDLDTARILVGGVGGIDLAGNVKNHLNWAPRLGVAYQLDEKTVIRAGYGRSYDIGVFGSLFGHSVTQNLPVLANQDLHGAESFDAAFNLANVPAPKPSPTPEADGTFPLPTGVTPHTNPREQRPPAVDAFNVTVQRQLTDTMAVEVGYVGNRGHHVFAGDGPEFDVNQPILDGFPTVPQNQRRPFFSGIQTTYLGLGGAFQLPQGINYFCDCANNWYDSLQAKLTKRFSGGYSAQVNYTYQKAEGESGDYFLWDRTLNKGIQDWDRTQILNVTLVWEIPFGREKKYGANSSGVVDAILGGWQFNATYTAQTGLPFNVNYNDAGADRDTGGNNRPNLTGNPDGPKTREMWFNAAPIGDPNSAFSRPGVGTFGDLERNALRGPYYRRTDASFFKHFRVGGDKDIEARIEFVNFFNNVNLGQPDSTIGVPGNPNKNAGRINSTAYGNLDPQRNVQFGVKFLF